MRTLAVLLNLLRTPRVLHKVLRNRLTAHRQYKAADTALRKLELLVLIVTRRCNLRCEMCMQDHDDHRKAETNRIEIEDYKKLLDEVTPWKPMVQITGGEPLLYKNIETLLHETKKRGLFVMMNTNGTMLEQHAKAIVESQVAKLTVSIEGPPEIHNKITQVANSYDKTIAGLKAVAEEKKRTGSAYPFIDVKGVITPANIGQMESIVQLHDTGWVQMVDFVHIWFLHRSQTELHDKLKTGVNYYPPHDMPLFKPEELRETMAHVRDLQKRYKSKPFIVFPDIPDDQMELYYSKPTELIHRANCIYPYESARVLPNGDVLCCPEDIAACGHLGNLSESSLTEIIRGEKAQAFLEKLEKANGAWPVCSRCCGIFRS